jgi:aspartyl-tRNA(Asn)/glutamyl-tRNA(Gln) amidotransferase subunit C
LEVLFRAHARPKKHKNDYDTLQLFINSAGIFHMPLSNEQVVHLTRLARLSMPDDVNVTRMQLDSIFTLIAQMQSVDTSNIEPMSHPQELAARLREDIVTETPCRAAFQAIAPQAEAGLYLVPKVIE